MDKQGSTKPKVRLRLIVALPVATSILMLVGALLTSYLMPQQLPWPGQDSMPDLRTVILLSVFCTIILSFLLNLLAAFLISRNLKRLMVKASSMIPVGPESMQKSEAANEMKALGIILDEVEVTLDRFIQDSYILENLPEALITVDAAGEVRALNRRAARLFNTALWNIRGRRLEEIVPKSLRNESFHRMVLKGFEGTESHSSLIRLSTDAKAELVLWVGVSPVELSGGQRGVTISFKDQTDIVSVRNQIQKLERLAAVGKVSAHIAHEVRNPLGSIKTLTELIREDLRPDETQAKYADVILDQVGRLDRLIEDVLSFSRSSLLNVEKAELPVLLSQMVDLARHSFPEKGVKVEEHYDPVLPPVWCDPERLCQAFLNVLINAFEACGSGGHIKVSATYERGGTANGSVIGIRVKDDGPGIPESNLQKAFEPFFTTKSHGTGLGLACTYNIINAHGGRIELANRPSGGASVQILLPENHTLESPLDEPVEYHG